MVEFGGSSCFEKFILVEGLFREAGIFGGEGWASCMRDEGRFQLLSMQNASIRDLDNSIDWMYRSAALTLLQEGRKLLSAGCNAGRLLSNMPFLERIPTFLLGRLEREKSMRRVSCVL